MVVSSFFAQTSSMIRCFVCSPPSPGWYDRQKELRKKLHVESFHMAIWETVDFHWTHTKLETFCRGVSPPSSTPVFLSPRPRKLCDSPGAAVPLPRAGQNPHHRQGEQSVRELSAVGSVGSDRCDKITPFWTFWPTHLFRKESIRALIKAAPKRGNPCLRSFCPRASGFLHAFCRFLCVSRSPK